MGGRISSLTLFAVCVGAGAGCVDVAQPQAFGGDAGADATNDALERAVGDVRVVGLAPAPWQMEGLALWGDLAFGTSALGLANTALPLLTLEQPSRIFGFNRSSGKLQETIYIHGEDLRIPHGSAGVKTDASGRLYAANIQLGILRFTPGPSGWTQETYAALPDIPSCNIAARPCSPTPDDQPPLPNDLAWDPDGNLYVSDSYQTTIWKIPPGASGQRQPEIWFQHPSMDRAFGVNGIRVHPDGTRFFIAVCCPDSASLGPIDRASRIVAVPFPNPGTNAPEDFVILPNGEGADGIVFNSAGKLYVASNVADKVLVIGPHGTIEKSFTNDDLSGPATFDFPASLVFDDARRSLVVTNYAYLDGHVYTANRNIIDVYVNDTGWPEPLPILP